MAVMKFVHGKATPAPCHAPVNRQQGRRGWCPVWAAPSEHLGPAVSIQTFTVEL